MRKIVFPEPEDPDWAEWRERCEAATNELIAAVEAGEEVVVNRDLYKEKKVAVYMAPAGPFKRKCAYCERDLANQHGDVDHYRPSKRVTDENRKPIRRNTGSGEEDHPGYYWLAYDWQNLLPSCTACNTASGQFTEGRVVGKWEAFPIENEDLRAWSPVEEGREVPLLVNPVHAYPEEHFAFHRTGVLGYKTPAGRVTRRLLGLDEEGLATRRKKRYEEVKTFTREFLATFDICSKEVQEEKREHLEALAAGEGEFTAYARLAIQDVLASHEQASEIVEGALGSGAHLTEEE